MRLALAMVVLLCLASCGAITDAFESVKATADAGTAFFNEAKADYVAARAEADVDGDGKVTGGEWLTLLLTMLGLNGGAAAAALIRNGKSNERKARTEAETAALKERLNALERAA